jgi:hypothetical protein
MVECLIAFLNVCYIARREDLDEASLNDLQYNVDRFHRLREVFREDVRPEGFSLPRQHSIYHYKDHVMEFAVPGGICSSITESRHITAVKQPWRRSNRHNALSQMLTTNQRLDKIAGAHVDFIARGMLPPDYEQPFAPQSKRPTASMANGRADTEAVDGELQAVRQMGLLKSSSVQCFELDSTHN